MAVPIKFETFGNLTDIVVSRAKIAGTAQPEDREFIQGAINEYYVNICTERPWTWRKFDRSFPFRKALKDGTVNVTQNSRIVTFTDITIDNSILFRTLQVISSTVDLYRIVGFNVTLQEAYLDSVYVGSTNAAANYRLYGYEFPLPPDCDTINQIYIDGALTDSGQLDELNVLEFNRYLSKVPPLADVPRYYTRDGNIFFNPAAALLDEFLLNYDFLGGTTFDQVARLRLLPTEPDIDRIIHLNYTIMVNPMVGDGEKPLIPIDDRSVLIHGALYEWWKMQGNMGLADRELRDYSRKLKEMRDEHHKTDTTPKLISQGSRYKRYHIVNMREDMFQLARNNEYT